LFDFVFRYDKKVVAEPEKTTVVPGGYCCVDVHEKQPSLLSYYKGVSTSDNETKRSEYISRKSTLSYGKGSPHDCEV